MQKTPIFCKIAFIVDLTFTLIRPPLVFLGLFLIFYLPDAGSLYRTSVLGLAIALLTALAGIPGNILMLMRKKVGVFFGCIAVSLSLLSIGLGVYRTTVIIFNGGTGLQLTSALTGLVLGLFLRFALSVLYIVALISFRNSFRKTAEIAASPNGYWVTTDE